MEKPYIEIAYPKPSNEQSKKIRKVSFALKYGGGIIWFKEAIEAAYELGFAEGAAGMDPSLIERRTPDEND